MNALARIARLLLIAGAVLLSVSGSASAAEPEAVAALLDRADTIKTADHAQFTALLDKIDAAAATLAPQQTLTLRYLKAWELVYKGDYTSAIPELDDIIAASGDPTLRFRAGITAVNALALAVRYEEAYSRLTQLLDELPQISNKEARIQAVGVAAILYNQAGQYDLGQTYAEKMAQESLGQTSECKAYYLKTESLFRRSRLHSSDAVLQQGIDACKKVKEPVWAGFIRSFVANLQLSEGDASAAIAGLKAAYDETAHTNYRRLVSEFDSILARAYWKQGDPVLARQFAQSAIDKAVKNEITKPLADAYQVLYEVAKQQGDYENALAYHEKYAAADKGYLNDTSARTLAYQMVNQQVLDKKRQIDALNEKNERLQLQQQVDVKTAETARLYILLLIVVLASIAFWAYKTKRSQLRFMRLARRDGLTGIFNRQHFIDAATDQLRYCAKSARDACVIVIDLDHFKSVNDVYGHATGDLVLKRAVKTCEDRLRSIDIFGRLGGEEFGIVLPDCALEQALRCADELRIAIAAVSGSDARIDFPVSASFGIAATHTSGYDLRELLANADSALYEAKREGRNRVAAYCTSTTVRSIAAATKAASAS